MRSEKFFVAVRLDKSSGREFFDADSFSGDPERSRAKARETDERISTWAHDNPVKRIAEVAVDLKLTGEADRFVFSVSWRAYWLLSENGFIAAVRGHGGASKAEQEAERAFAQAKFSGKGNPVEMSVNLAGLGVIRSWFASILDEIPDDVEVAEAAVETRSIEAMEQKREVVSR